MGLQSLLLRSYRVYTSSETVLRRLASEPTALGGSPNPLRKAASVSIKGRWELYAL